MEEKTIIKDDIQNDLEEKDKEIEELKNKYLYLQADLENVKRRYNKQIEDLMKYEGESIFVKLIQVLDTMEYSIGDCIDCLNNYNVLINLLNNFGVHQIYKDERPIFFNSDYDEAVTSVETNDPNLDNSINKVYQKGYFYKDKILRFEKVIVNKYNE